MDYNRKWLSQKSRFGIIAPKEETVIIGLFTALLRFSRFAMTKRDFEDRHDCYMFY
jgi:hypothetical protein